MDVKFGGIEYGVPPPVPSNSIVYGNPTERKPIPEELKKQMQENAQRYADIRAGRIKVGDTILDSKLQCPVCKMIAPTVDVFADHLQTHKGVGEVKPNTKPILFPTGTE